MLPAAPAPDAMPRQGAACDTGRNAVGKPGDQVKFSAQQVGSACVVTAVEAVP